MPVIFGMELHQLLSFTKQLGLALAGAACLWGFVFLWASRRRNAGAGTDEAATEKQTTLEWAANRLLLLFAAGFALAAASWFVLWNIWPALAHEGINLYPADAEYRRAFLITLPVYITWIIATLAALAVRLRRPGAFQKYLHWFYGIQFLFVAFLISTYAWSGDALGKEQIFFYFHGFHSIFTLGTVLTLDFLFMSSRFSLRLQQHIFPFFPAISKIIFIGLGLDFASAYLVFGDALHLSPRFFMAQTAVGILIVNGVILAGPMTRKILGELRAGRMLSGAWKTASGVCGPVSMVSWLTITFIDFFPDMTLSYVQLFAAYAAAILFGIGVKLFVLDKMDARRAGAGKAAQ